MSTQSAAVSHAMLSRNWFERAGSTQLGKRYVAIYVLQVASFATRLTRFKSMKACYIFCEKTGCVECCSLPHNISLRRLSKYVRAEITCLLLLFSSIGTWWGSIWTHARQRCGTVFGGTDSAAQSTCACDERAQSLWVSSWFLWRFGPLRNSPPPWLRSPKNPLHNGHPSSLKISIRMSLSDMAHLILCVKSFLSLSCCTS